MRNKGWFFIQTFLLLLILFSPFRIILYLPLSVRYLGLFFIILGIYSAATDGMQRMLAAKSVDRELVATGQGFLNMALGFSSLGAGIIGGLLWTKFSAESALIYAAILSTIGLVLFIALSKKLR